MGQFMRGSSRGARTAWLGKVTVKASERAIIFSLGGKPRTVVGPKRVRLYFATVIFLDRRIASEFEYLEVRFLDGVVQHIPGPASLFQDPTVHAKVSVFKALQLQPGESAVVHSKAPLAKQAEAASRSAGAGAEESPKLAHPVQAAMRVESGPSIIVPQPNEWVHDFEWSFGGNAEAEALSKLPTFRQTLEMTFPAVAGSGDAFEAAVHCEYDVADAGLAAMASQDPLHVLMRALTVATESSAASMPIEAVVRGADDCFSDAKTLAEELGLRLTSARWTANELPPALVASAAARRNAETRAATVDAELALEDAAAERRRQLAKSTQEAELERMRARFAVEVERVRSLTDAGVDVTKVLASGDHAVSRLLFGSSQSDKPNQTNGTQ